MRTVCPNCDADMEENPIFEIDINKKCLILRLLCPVCKNIYYLSFKLGDVEWSTPNERI